MKITVIDGQGGKMGRAIIEMIKGSGIEAELVAVGTNSAATISMMAAKPDAGATGENAVIVNSRDADFIVGPIGVIAPDSLHGEISPAMAAAVGASPATKILLPVARCGIKIPGMPPLSMTEMLEAIPGEIIAAKR